MENLLHLRSFLVLLTVFLQWAWAFSAEDTNWEDGHESQKKTLFTFTLKQSCDDWVFFSWDSTKEVSPAAFEFPGFTACEITYMNQDSQVAKFSIVVLHLNQRTIKLSDLNTTSHYAASMTCNETLTSNTVYFVTGYPCLNAEMEEYDAKLHPQSKNKTEVLKEPIDVATVDSEYSVRDVVLGLLFALCGALVIACFGYYYWKKRRHRQRILRIFGQSHADPFLALHTPSDQSGSSF